MTNTQNRSPQIGIWTLASMVIANMIGVGVFTSSGFSLGDLGNPARVMLAWWLCGVWAICGAIAYGALVSRLPMSGGEYLFLSRFCHPSIGFLAGWISLIAGFTAPIAAAAKGAALYGAGKQDPLTDQLIAAGVIIAATLAYLMGVNIGARIQNAIVALKLVLLAAIIVFAFSVVSSTGWQGEALPGRDASWWPESFSAWTVLLGSMSWVALSYTGFNAAVYVAGQAQDAAINVPRAMLRATIVVTIIYLLLNAVFVYAPAPGLIAGQEEVAAIVGRAIGGAWFESLIRFTITLAMLTSVFAMLLAGPRVYQKMAEDGVMPKLFNSDGPAARLATVFQAALSVIAVFAADLLQLMKYLGLTLSACGALAVMSLWWMRKRLPDAKPLQWWENLALSVYVLITLAILVASYQTHRAEFYAMLITFAVGIVFYAGWGWTSLARRKPSPS
ncbi:MAG: amino acid permease [Pirellulaceae bacterium]|nr:amino acid permease [Pirellulaceae bacterium]